MEYFINKVGIKGIVCADKFRDQDYYEIMLQCVPELKQSTPGKLNSSKVPSLKTIIRISDDYLKLYFFLYSYYLN